MKYPNSLASVLLSSVAFSSPATAATTDGRRPIGGGSGGGLRANHLGLDRPFPLFASNSAKKSDLTAVWYKPHNECGSTPGSTPQVAADFINRQMNGDVAADFVGIAAWQPSDSYPIGNNDTYGIVSSVCGYDSTEGTTPQVLFYNKDAWKLESSYPASPKCTFVPLAPWEGPLMGDVCFKKTQPGEDDCCLCVYSEEEYSWGDQMQLGLGQRPWVAGIFNRTNANKEQVCVVAAQFPHPLQNTTLRNVNGNLTSDPQPFTLQKYVCTNDGTEGCVPNLSNTSPIIFGSDVLVTQVESFCGEVPIVFMADTNVGPGYVPSGSLFSDQALSLLEDKSSVTPYTCCNDTQTNRGLNTYATDRIAVSGPALKIDALAGGSVAPRGDVISTNMGYQCHSLEEHLPLRAHISFQN